MLLPGCGTTNTKYKTLMVNPQVPEQLLTCDAAPKPPTEGTQKDVASYILKMYKAYDDCEGNLASVSKLLKDFEESGKDEE